MTFDKPEQYKSSETTRLSIHHSKHHHQHTHPPQDPKVSSSANHNSSYYAKCLLGGGLSSSVRWVLTPMDFIKCSMQANPNRFPSFTAGMAMVFREQGVSGLYRGLIPTILAYSTQSGTKYACYEFFKDTLNRTVGPEHASSYKSVIYVVSAGCAEAIADVLMCPWEMLKVKVQTTKAGEFPSHFRPALHKMMAQRRDFGFPFGSLKPLWSRQVIGTMANFLVFEHTVHGIYTHILHTHNKNDYGQSVQLGVTFAAGYVSGFVATVVSHPADSLLSLQARYPDKSFQEIIHRVGWKNLATHGLLPRVALTGTIIASQWLLYDSFKSLMGLGTSGGAD
mmetsp:Transcript_10702/g.19632  ORF Transcript_10702/g.19632 Transcript_10702/m.19632 type:complete len:337 (+) Transcript_10702:140-1150(+)